MAFNIKTPREAAVDTAKRVRLRRLEMNLSQKTLAERSGISYGALKKFEQTGQISFESLLKLAVALDAFSDFEVLFSEGSGELPVSLDELIIENKRKRGRQ